MNDEWTSLLPVDVNKQREDLVTHPAKILWSEGVSLAPQHLQCLDDYHDARLHTVATSLHPLPWGVRHANDAEIDHELGTLSLPRLDVILPSGEHIRAPYPDDLPHPLTLEDIAPDKQSIVIYVALPLVRAEGGNCAAGDDRGRRFTARSGQVADAYGQQPAIPMHFVSHAPRLVNEDDTTEGMSKLAVLRLRRGASGRFQPDASYIAPSVTVEASPPLQARLARLLGILRAKAAALTADHSEPVQQAVAYRAGDHASFWLLHTVNASAAALAHIMAVPGVPPERLHQELLRLAGGLMAFSRRYELTSLPSYNHETSDDGFNTLFRIVTDLVDTVIPTTFVAIPLQRAGTSYVVGKIDSQKIDARAALYLGVSAATIGQDLAAAVPKRFKIGAPDDVEKAVTSALPCVAATHVAIPPAAIPVKPGFSYFFLDPRGEPYERMLKSEAVRIFTPSGMDELALEMFAVIA